MDRDGTKAGFDLALTRAVARAVSIPVIASGGVGALEHFAEGVIEGEADAVLAASVFHFGTFSIRQVKEYMASAGHSLCGWTSSTAGIRCGLSKHGFRCSCRRVWVCAWLRRQRRTRLKRGDVRDVAAMALMSADLRVRIRPSGAW